MGKMADRKEVMGNMLESENHDSAIKKAFCAPDSGRKEAVEISVANST